MKKAIEELEKLAKELRAKDDGLSIEVREAGGEAQKGFERFSTPFTGCATSYLHCKTRYPTSQRICVRAKNMRVSPPMVLGFSMRIAAGLLR